MGDNELEGERNNTGERHGGKREREVIKRKTVTHTQRKGGYRAVAIAPGTTFLSAVASLSAKCTFDALPHMLL